MTYIRRSIAVGLLVGCAAAPAGAATHDLAFWRGVVQNTYAPPAGSDVPMLVDELAQMLASPDPERRDDIAYATLTSWIYQQKIVDAATLRPLAGRLLTNLTAGIGEHDTDSIFRRSFSALMISVIVARDNADPFLGVDEWHRVEQAVVTYLTAEQDLRGYDPQKGWIHSAAHTADALKFLGRSRYLDAAGQQRILEATGRKLTGATVVFTFGEDERFARALLSLAVRKDFDAPAFSAWLARTKPAVSPHPTLAELHASQNWKNLLAKFEVLLSAVEQPSDGAAAARSAIRSALKELF